MISKHAERKAAADEITVFSVSLYSHSLNHVDASMDEFHAYPFTDFREHLQPHLISSSISPSLKYGYRLTYTDAITENSSEVRRQLTIDS